MTNTLKLIVVYTIFSIKCQLEYKINATLIILSVFCGKAVGVIALYFALLEFKTINGWNIDELMFLFSLYLLTHSLFLIFFSGFKSFDDVIYSGDFDRYMLRPLGLFFQVIVSRFEFLTSIGYFLLGFSLFFYSADKISLEWSFYNNIFYSIMILSGVCIQAALFIFLSCFSFRFVRVDNLRMVFFYNLEKFNIYPLSIFPNIIQNFLMFIIPFAYINYFPAQFFLRKEDLNKYWIGNLYISPFIAIILLILSYNFWKLSLKHYASTGNSIESI